MTVRTKIIAHTQYIQASSSCVWRHITEVDIASFPHSLWLSVLGIPKPLRAEILQSGVGGSRVAYFGNGKRFSQDITVWEPHKEYCFEFHPDEGFGVGYILDLATGPFQMSSGRYTISVEKEGVLLELQSTYQLLGLFGYILQIPVYLTLCGFQKYLLYCE